MCQLPLLLQLSPSVVNAIWPHDDEEEADNKNWRREPKSLSKARGWGKKRGGGKGEKSFCRVTEMKTFSPFRRGPREKDN